jgi:anti-sigma B factor antagonist
MHCLWLGSSHHFGGSRPGSPPSQIEVSTRNELSLFPPMYESAVSSRLRLRTRTVDGCLVVEVGGEVDMSSAPTLRDHLLGHIVFGEPCVVVDLSDVGFMDSTGLSALVVAYRQAGEVGSSLFLAGAQPAIRRLLKITQLDALLEHRDDVADAVAAAQASRDRGPTEPTATPI